MLTLAVFASLLVAPSTPQIQDLRFESLRSAFLDPFDNSNGSISFIADLTGDGLPDLSASRFSSDGTFFRGVADGLYSKEAEVLTASGRPFDLDLDGDVDLLGPGVVFLNNGDGTFVDASAGLPACSFPSCSAAYVDVNGDGAVDMVHAFSSTTPDRVLMNDGAGGFTETAGILPAGFATDGRLFAFDATGDGLEDLFSESATDELLLLENLGGTFAPPVATGTFLLAGQRDVFDYDADGDLDLLLLEPNPLGGGRVHWNDGAGTFTSGPRIPFPPSELVPLDADGDGRTDYVAVSRELDYIESRTDLFRSEGGGVFTHVPGAVPQNFLVTAREAVDADGDGDLDLDGDVFAFGKSIALNDGTGRFVDVGHSGPGAPGRVESLAFVDLVGWRELEQVTCMGGSLFLDRAPGRFPARVEEVALPNRMRAQTVTAFDADGDGRDELLVEDEFRAVVLKRGPRKPVARVPFGLGDRPVLEREVADADADGDLDLFVLYSGGGFALFRNDGNGDFAADPASGLQPPNPRAMASIDVDGDRSADLIVLESNRPVLYRNDGSGRFSADPGGFQNAGSASLAEPVTLDYDGDGDDDLAAWPSFGGGAPIVYENDGSGVFTVAPGVLSTTAFQSFPWFVADLDADGDEDLVGSDRRGYVWENLGGGSFQERVGVFPGSLERGSLADFDRDGDVDLASSSPRRILTNLTRQVALRAVPRIGSDLTVDVFGEAGSPWLLLSSSQRGPGVPTAMGLSFLEGSPTSRGSGTLDADGQASVTLAIPNAISLVGSTLHWQAAVGGSTTLTNLETSTLTGL